MNKRSYEYFKDNIFGNVADTYEECYYSGYDIGYTDCKKNLVDKACEWINNNIEGYDCTPTGIGKLLVDFRKAMEE